MNFENPKKSFLETCLTMIYWKFWTFILKIMFMKDCSELRLLLFGCFFFYLGIFFLPFSGLRAVSSKILKDNRIDFRKTKKKILPWKSSKGVIFKFLAFEYWTLETMPCFSVFGAFYALFQKEIFFMINYVSWEGRKGLLVSPLAVLQQLELVQTIFLSNLWKFTEEKPWR